jgi:pyruvate dehydrogenase E1 component alpha subunit
VWRLPVVFVCENNWYMEYTPIGDVIPVALPAADRAAAYGLDRIVVDGNDVAAVRQVVGDAVGAARRGQGPSLVEAQTYRLKGHSAADGATYRPAGEVAQWRERDPLVLARSALGTAGTAAEKLAEIDTRITADLAELARQVLARPAPDPAGAWADVWSDGSWQWRN